MDKQKANKIVSAIVPSYNEGTRITKVLDVLISHPELLEVIVVDDGSEDNTSDVLEKYRGKIKVIRNYCNMGKGYSMERGVLASSGEIIFFCDADVSGITREIISQIIDPVVKGETEMFIGMRNRKIYFTKFVIPFIPLMGGERAVTKFLWENTPDYFKHKFRIEAGLNYYADRLGKGYDFEIIKGMRQVIKEKKYGLLNGLRQRFSMYADVVAAEIVIFISQCSDYFKLGELGVQKNKDFRT